MLWTPGGGGLLNPYSTVSGADEQRGIDNAEKSPIHKNPDGTIPQNTPPFPNNDSAPPYSNPPFPDNSNSPYPGNPPFPGDSSLDNTDTGNNTHTGGGSCDATDLLSPPYFEARKRKPNDFDDSEPEFKKSKPNISGKEGAKDVPSWARGERPKVGESGKDFAKRLMDKKYGSGNYKTKGGGSEFNKIRKWGDRNFE